MENTNTQQPPVAANERLMLVKLSEHQWYPRKYDKAVSEEIAKLHGAESAEAAGRYNKLLVEIDSIKPLKQAFTRLKAFHYEYTLPWSDRGERVLPVDLYFEYVEKVRDFREEIDRLAADFAYNEYERQREAAKVRLNGMFREQDYPPADQVYGRFGVDVKFSPLPNPDDCRVWGIGDQAAEQIQADVRANLEEATREAQQAVVNQVIERGHEFIEKVGRYHKGDTKKLYATAVENLRDITSLVLKGLNVTNDLQLTALAKQLNELIDDTNIDKLKVGEDHRKEKIAKVEKTLAKFEGIF
jgi:hypothetical protein